MSCLAPAPLSDLVTKEHLETVLSAQFTAFALALAAQRETDRKEFAAEFKSIREEIAAEFKLVREETADEFKSVGEATAVEFRTLREEVDELSTKVRRLAFWLPFEVLGALATVVAVTEWLRG